MIGKALVGIGIWLISDGIYSWVLYKHTQSWRGEKQNFAKDHYIRLIRIILGIIIVVLGAVGD